MKKSRRPRKFYYTLEDIAKYCGLTKENLRQKVARGQLFPEDFTSVINFLAEHHFRSLQIKEQAEKSS